MNHPTISYQMKNQAAWIRLNRPEQRNALRNAEIDGLYHAMSVAIAEANCRVIVLSATGTVFCAGADLKQPPITAKKQDIDAQDTHIEFSDLLRFMVEAPKPIVVAVNGSAFAGGLGLIGAADIAISVEQAEFSFTEVRIGVIPAIISVVCLHKIGRAQGMKLFLTAERFDAHAAKEYGLIQQVVGQTELEEAVNTLVAELSMGAPIALAECKKLVHTISETDLEQGMALAAKWSARLFDSDEALEGRQAFQQKRPPKWRIS